jgi:hypothetical protein
LHFTLPWRGRELLCDLLGEIMPANPWYNRVNASALSDEAPRLILERVKRKLGFEKTLRALGIALSEQIFS